MSQYIFTATNSSVLFKGCAKYYRKFLKMPKRCCFDFVFWTFSCAVALNMNFLSCLMSCSIMNSDLCPLGGELVMLH